jgi:hypothetical protein
MTKNLKTLNMKLFIYDKFWDAFLKINKGTQSKLPTFYQQNLEPIQKCSFKP